MSSTGTKTSEEKNNAKLQVSGANKYGTSENTHSQTKERRQTSTNAAVTSYESEKEEMEEEMNQVVDEEIDEVPDDAMSSGSDFETEQ